MPPLCAVCLAKEACTAVPKRKCTCESGQTQQRNRRVSRKRVESLSMFEMDHDPLEHLFDLEECEQEMSMNKQEDGTIRLNIGEPSPDALDFHVFQHAFWKALGDKQEVVDCQGMISLWSQADVQGFEKRFAKRMEELRRRGIVAAIQHGDLRLMEFWLDSSLLSTPRTSVSDLCPCYVEARGHAATPLWIAVAYGRPSLAQKLIERGADLEAQASDGSTPFWRACAHAGENTPALLHLLHRHDVDLQKADQDGTAPVHAAAAYGNWKAIKFLHEHGVNMETPGCVFGLGGDWDHLRKGLTPLQIAREWTGENTVEQDPGSVRTEEYDRIVDFLESLKRSNKRPLEPDAISVEERARRLGLSSRLKSVPPNLHTSSETGAADEKAAAKKEIRQIQKSNLQIVARAEQAASKSAPAVQLQAYFQYLPDWTVRGEQTDELGFTPTDREKLVQVSQEAEPGPFSLW